jgi:hypothetical protein
MNNPTGNLWNYTWTVDSYPPNNSYYFRIIASDVDGNINDTTIEYFNIVDTINPSVEIYSYDTQTQAGIGFINVQINATDNYQIQNPVQIRFYEPDSTVIGTFSMNNPSGDLWNYTWDVGSYAPDTNYYFRIIASDVDGNINNTAIEYFNVIDTINPSAVIYSYDSLAQAGIGIINVQVNVTDNYQIQSPVQIRFYEPDSTVIGTFSMNSPTENLWNYTWYVGSFAPDANYYFRIIVSDVDGNINDSAIEYFNIVDTLNPSVVIYSYDTQTEPSIGSINVQVNVTDNYQIQSPVQIRFYEPDSTVIGTFTMNNPAGNLWNYTWDVGFFAPDVNYYFRIIASDVDGNTNNTVVDYFNIIDIINPSVVVYSFDNQTQAGIGFINVQINATDNYQIQSPVQIRFYEPDSTVVGTFSMANPFGNTWTYTWNVGSYSPNNSYYFRIIASDEDSNINDTTIEYFNIIDTLNPSVIIHSYDDQAETVIGSINIQVNISDNYQIQSPVQIRFYEPDSTVIGTFSMTNSIGITWIYTWNVGSFSPGSSYYFRIIANDTLNNMNNTALGFFDITEHPPNPPILTIITTSPTYSFNISLEWTISTDANNYTLYRYSSPINSSNLHLATQVKTITGTTTTDMVPGIGRWYYAVVATNRSGSSDLSNYEFIDVQEALTGGNPSTIPGYPLFFIGLISIIMILIVYKKSYQIKQKT